MNKKSNKLEQEKRTFIIMIHMYCKGHHKYECELCPECMKLAEYAEHRLEKCPYGGNKPVCSKCPIHCYQPQMRQRMREIMRYSGPRMIYRHPVLAVLHLLEGRRALPECTRITDSKNAERKNENERKD